MGRTPRNGEFNKWDRRGKKEKKIFMGKASLKMTLDEVKSDLIDGKAKDEFQIIPIDAIGPSPSNPRKVFHSQPLDELAASIAVHGILEPVLVTRHENPAPDSDEPFSYWIVAGERRYKAAHKAGLKDIPCIVKDLTPDQVFDIQIDENWQRSDLEPMDEARALRFITEERGWTVAECAARLSKDPRFIAQRLKLNDLVPEAQKGMDEGKLPTTHAYLICRYEPADQAYLIKEMYGKDFKAEADTSYSTTLSNLKSLIKANLENLLDNAPFDLTDKNLRADGLTCVECPQRAGANPTLFEPVKAKEDRCLNRTCFKAKSEQHYQNMLSNWTAKGKKRFGEDYQATMVWYYSKPHGKQYATAISQEHWKEATTLTDNGNKAKFCKSAEHALLVTNWDPPKEARICRDKECPDHWKAGAGASSSSSRSHNQAADPKKLEERFECAVRKIVGPRIVFEAAAALAPQITDKAFMTRLAAVAWQGAQEYSNAEMSDAYIRLVTGWNNEYVGDWGLVAPWLDRKLSEQQLSEFLFVISWSERVQSSNYNQESNGEILQLADKVQLDYRLYDAEARLSVAEHQKLDAKQMKKLQAYLDAVRSADSSVVVPRLWSKKFTPDDTIRQFSDEEISEEFDPEETDSDNF